MMLIVRFSKDSFKVFCYNTVTVPTELKIEDELYFQDSNSKGSEGFIGFFDWLRKSEHQIVGIRMCFLEDQEYNSYLKTLYYIYPTFNERCMELLFDESGYSEELSGDQDFGNNFAFVSNKGNWIFTFPLDKLESQEMKSLLKYCQEI